ncbi:O-6-methylguanine DNA methyltransferase [Burkholderiales bacterium JOSHI_001]|nr:O-6-methylguanine DNA methyltransferase [Burkholderiales bacterium JOSHI_001]
MGRWQTTFHTALGRCLIGWGDAGIHRVRLPGAGVGDEVAGTMPGFVQQAIAGMQQLVDSGRANFDALPLDLSAGSDFERRVWQLTRHIPAGRTLSYGELAAQLGERGAARSVGMALGRNPVPLLVPCHRVLGAGGTLVGFSAPGGTHTKARLLAIERAQVGDAPQLF